MSSVVRCDVCGLTVTPTEAAKWMTLQQPEEGEPQATRFSGLFMDFGAPVKSFHICSFACLSLIGVRPETLEVEA